MTVAVTTTYEDRRFVRVPTINKRAYQWTQKSNLSMIATNYNLPSYGILWSQILLLLLFTVTCSKTSSNPTPPTDQTTNDKGTSITVEAPKNETLIVDLVKTRKDPKGGFFGPELRDVYYQGRDVPEHFCGKGPSIPTGELITIFYRDAESTPHSSHCKEVIAVAKGSASWVNGKPFTHEELVRLREEEEHFHSGSLVNSEVVLSPAWHKPKPIGDPCPDSSGSPNDIMHRYKGQPCSLVVVFSRDRATWVLLVNWKVVGFDEGWDVEPPPEIRMTPVRDIVETIRKQYGDKYVLLM